MGFAEVALPAAIAARPRDARGYPVPAITPWSDGQPLFAATGTARTYLCAVERRCSICALPIEPGPVWRVVGGAESAAIEAALAAGEPYLNRAATAEAPGHRTCMLYASIVCPYLARPNARRGTDAEVAGLAATKGFRRGVGGAVAGFAEFEFRYVPVGSPPVDTVLFRFAGLAEFLPHEEGEEQLPALIAAVGAEATDAPLTAAPAYLLADEDLPVARLAEYVAGRLPHVGPHGG